MELTIKKEVEQVINIETPCFFRDGYQKYLAVLGEDQTISFINRDSYKSIQTSDSWLFKQDIKDAVNSWQKIDESEFLQAHKEFINSLSLEPQLTNVDDVKDVL